MPSALRTLARTPAFTAIAVLTLAIGIGANSAIFSVVHGVLLRPLPFEDPERLVQVWTSTPDEARSSHSADDFLDLQRENQSLTALAGYRTAPFGAIPGGASDAVAFEGAYVTVDFFDVLRVAPAAGRLFTRAQDGAGSEAAVVLSQAAWAQLFASRSDAIGQRVRLNDEPHTVVGVLPRGAEWPETSDLWVLSKTAVPPSPVDVKDPAASRDVRYFEAIGRLKPGVSLPQAQDELERIGAVIRTRHAEPGAPREVRVGPVRDALVGGVRRALLVMQAAVGLVLLIACANVASLLIARATARRRELTIRTALGASRSRLIRQLLTESLILGVGGGVAGLLLGAWLLSVLLRILPAGIPRAEGIALDTVVVLVTMVAAIGCSVLFGTFPAVQASRADAAAALKSSGERTSGARARGRAALVVAEVALTLVLLVGAGLLINSFLRLQRVDSGFRTEQVTLMGMAIPQSKYPTGASQTEFYRRLLERLESRPEVQAVGVGFPGPLRGDNASGSFYIDGRTGSGPDDRAFACIATVSGGYFEALGMPLIAGRTFTEADNATAPDVVIVSAQLAKRYWPGEEAVGKRLRFDQKGDWITVVGVVGDARQLGLDEAPPPVLYFPYAQFALPFMNVAVRSAAPEASVAALIRSELKAADASLPPGSISNLQRILDRSVAQPRFRSALLGAFALLALALAAIGVYGLISYSVAQRTREIGIRVALGAVPRQVLGPVIREGMVLAAAGVVLGLAGALAAARVLGQFLFDVSATDPVTFASVSIVLLGVALLASYVPSRRALKIDPILALRAE